VRSQQQGAGCSGGELFSLTKESRREGGRRRVIGALWRIVFRLLASRPQKMINE